jgi:hypothetical protein
MEAAGSSKMLVKIYWTKQNHIQKDSSLHSIVSILYLEGSSFETWLGKSMWLFPSALLVLACKYWKNTFA